MKRSRYLSLSVSREISLLNPGSTTALAPRPSSSTRAVATSLIDSRSASQKTPLDFASCGTFSGRSNRKPTPVAGSSVYHQGLLGKQGSQFFHCLSSDPRRAALRQSSGSISKDPPRTTRGNSFVGFRNASSTVTEAPSSTRV